MTVNSDTTLTGTVVGVGVPVLIKFNSHVFSGGVPLSGNLLFAKGNPGKVLTDLGSKSNGAVNCVHVAAGGAESVVIVSTSSQLLADYPCIALWKMVFTSLVASLMIKKMFPTTGENFGIACILIKVDSIDVFANNKDTHFNCVWTAVL